MSNDNYSTVASSQKEKKNSFSHFAQRLYIEESWMCDSGEEDEGTNIGLTKLCMQWFSEMLPPSLQLLILLGSSQGFNVAPFSLAQTSCFDFRAFSSKPFLCTSRQWGKVSVLCGCNLLRNGTVIFSRCLPTQLYVHDSVSALFSHPLSPHCLVK